MIKQTDIDKIFAISEEDTQKLDVDELKKAFQVVKLQLQEINDNLEAGLRSYNIKEFRNILVFNDWGNCDASNDFIMDFEISDDMTKIIQVKVSFKIRDYMSPITL